MLRRNELARRWRREHLAHRAAWEARDRARHREQRRAYGNERYKDSKSPTMLSNTVRRLMLHPQQYSLQTSGIGLRPYQAEPLERILSSIEGHLGNSFVLIFPRQSGKDEFLLQLKLYLADLYSVVPVSIVEVNPTYQPQTAAAIQRFDRLAEGNILTRGQWKCEGAFTRRLGQLEVRFLSGDRSANVTGATASLLLIINEAQDISPDVYRRKFEPMAASTNATRIFAGTAWTSRTLLAQEREAALEAERRDGRKRVYTADALDVGKCVPWYAAHVQAAVERHGRQHPLIKSQYFNEEIDAETGMFNARRLALMRTPPPNPPPNAGSGGRNVPGAQPAFRGGEPRAGAVSAVVFTLDVAGQDESRFGDPSQTRIDAGFGNPGRDSTSLSIIGIDLSDVKALQAPVYRVLHRQQWLGLDHLTIFGQLRALAETWRPLYIVVDATGVGEGLWAMLSRAFGGGVIPVKFSAQKKSEVGYRFLSLIETGRFKDQSEDGEEARRAVEAQYSACVSEILTGPQKTMRWGVPDGTRDAFGGELIHDDIILADALITEVDALPQGWTVFPSAAQIIRPEDPLEGMSHFR